VGLLIKRKPQVSLSFFREIIATCAAFQEQVHTLKTRLFLEQYSQIFEDTSICLQHLVTKLEVPYLSDVYSTLLRAMLYRHEFRQWAY
jgi:hypothetical protein